MNYAFYFISHPLLKLDFKETQDLSVSLIIEPALIGKTCHLQFTESDNVISY